MQFVGGGSGGGGEDPVQQVCDLGRRWPLGHSQLSIIITIFPDLVHNDAQIRKDCTIFRDVTNPPEFEDIPLRLTGHAFWEMFGQVEHEGLDFKGGVPDNIRETIPAMAMTSGGIIVHGVDSRGRISGCPLSQATQDRISRYAKECDVPVRVKAVSVDATQLTITAVPEIRGRIVTTPDGRLLRRVGGDCQPLRGDALARFVQQRVERSGEDQPIDETSGFDPASIHLDVLNEALAADRRPPINGDRDSIVRALIDFNLAEPSTDSTRSRVLTAALVLFGNEPDQKIPGARVQLVRRPGIGPGPGPTSAREECIGPLSRVLDCCLDFIARHTQQFEIVVGRRRETISEYPETVLREAILNALAHRDYGLVGATIDITVWDDRIEVRSPGPLPGHITVGNMRAEHYSRNPRIMRVLKTMRLVEEYGEGIDRMHQEMEVRLMEPPIFDAAADSVTVTLLNRSPASVEDQTWLSMLGTEQLSAEERLALLLARNEGSVTPRRLRQLRPESDAGRILQVALAKGLLERTGKRGGSRYELSAEMRLRVGATGIAAQGRKQQRLLDEIHRQGSISTAEGAALLGESMARTRGLLNGLVEEGSARAEGQTRARRYYSALF